MTGLLAYLPPRDQIAAAIETMVAVLDVLDGDPDVESNGDELDNGCDEDAPLFAGEAPTPYGMGVGCPISDPGEDGHDREEVEF